MIIIGYKKDNIKKTKKTFKVYYVRVLFSLDSAKTMARNLDIFAKDVLPPWQTMYLNLLEHFYVWYLLGVYVCPSFILH